MRARLNSTLSREEAFARVLRHSDFRAAVGRGAIPVWLPRLEPDVMDQIEGKHITFGQARDGKISGGQGIFADRRSRSFHGRALA